MIGSRVQICMSDGLLLLYLSRCLAQNPGHFVSVLPWYRVVFIALNTDSQGLLAIKVRHVVAGAARASRYLGVLPIEAG